MPALVEILPEFVDELAEYLLKDGRADLVTELRGTEITRWTHSETGDVAVAYIYLQSPRKLNLVEENVISVKHGATLSISQHKNWVYLDTDNFGRVKRYRTSETGQYPRAVRQSHSTLSPLRIEANVALLSRGRGSARRGGG
jgi:hypothetical protein